MATKKKLLEVFSVLFGLGFHTLELIASQLSKAGLVESKGRGPYAPEATPRDCARLFLGCVGAESTSTVAITVKRFLACTGGAVGRLEDRLINIFSSPHRAYNVAAIHVCRTKPEVEIHYEDMGQELYRLPDGYTDEHWESPDPGLEVWAWAQGMAIFKIAIFLENQDLGGSRYENYIEELKRKGWRHH